MVIELGALATTVVGQILVPYLKEGAKKIADEASKKFGESAGHYAADLAGKIWDRVKATFTSDREKNTVADFQEKPEDAKDLMVAKLREKLQNDPKLAEELQKLVNAQSPDGKGTGAQIIGATYAGIVDARGATISGGVVGGIVMSPTSPPPPPPTTRPKE
jgi:regulator of sigma D